MTLPAGTVRLVSVVTVPTASVAPVIAVVAAACVNPTTFGTVVCGRPDDTTRVTLLLTRTSVPAVGFWLITDPLGTVRLVAVVTVPTASVAPVIAVVAAVCVKPTTFGTVVCGRPDDTTNVTALLTSTSLPAVGF